MGVKSVEMLLLPLAIDLVSFATRYLKVEQRVVFRCVVDSSFQPGSNWMTYHTISRHIFLTKTKSKTAFLLPQAF